MGKIVVNVTYATLHYQSWQNIVESNAGGISH